MTHAVQPRRWRPGQQRAQGRGAGRGRGGGPDADPLGRRRSRPRRLLDTPKRVARAWKEYAKGYAEDPALHLSRTFEEVGGYDEIVLLKDIPFQSHCEHHMAPIIGKASIAYLPRDRVVGISKLARVLHGFARRLQVQERLTAEVADCICEHLQPKGVAVVIEAEPRLHDRARGRDAGRDDDHQPDDTGGARATLQRAPARPPGTSTCASSPGASLSGRSRSSGRKRIAW